MIPAPLKNIDCLFLAEEDHTKSGSACLAVVEPTMLVKMAENFLAEGFYLEDVSGLVVSEGAVSVYHFDHFDKPGRCTVLSVSPLGAAKFPSIAGVYQGAEWHERETRDFFGFEYDGNPNFIPLLMPEDMPDVHPLMKEEAVRVPLATLFSAPGRNRAVVSKTEGFTLLDLPESEKKEEAKPAEKPQKTEAKTAPATKESKTEKPAAASNAKAVKEDSGKKGETDA